MKRSQINASIAHAKALLAKNNIMLPFFGYLTPAKLRACDLTYIKVARLSRQNIRYK